MKIYTKTGDKGQTSLIGGTRVAKHHIRIESYGTVDELNSYIGLIACQEIEAHHQIILKEIQDRLFTVGASLAADPEKSNPPAGRAGILIYWKKILSFWKRKLTK
jgi:cob(I)alamin adenosyltransferase